MASPGDWYASLPPVSKAWGTACVATTVLVQFRMVSAYTIALLWHPLINQFEIWRLLTPFLFIGKFGLAFVMNLMILITYCVPLEKVTFENKAADFVFMLIFGMAVLLVTSPITGLPFTAVSLIFMVLYVWTRFNPNQQISLWGILKIKGFHLPWALLVLGMLLGNNPVVDLAGIVAGHLYYFLSVLYPRSSGIEILKTPDLVKQLCMYAGIGEFRYVAHQPRSFAGRGRRLGDHTD